MIVTTMVACAPLASSIALSVNVFVCTVVGPPATEIMSSFNGVEPALASERNVERHTARVGGVDRGPGRAVPAREHVP